MALTEEAKQKAIDKILNNPNGATATIGVGITLLMVSLLMFIYFYAMMRAGFKRTIFNKEFMAQFKEEATEMNWEEIPTGGAPDNGNGYYADKLSYAEWYHFNNVQRTQLNSLELNFIMAIFMLVGTFNYPTVGFSFSVLMVVGRLIFVVGYEKCGPKGRIPGALLADVAIIGLFVLSIMSIFKDSKYEGKHMTRTLPFTP